MQYRCHDQLGCLEKTRNDKMFLGEIWYKSLKDCQQNCKYKSTYIPTSPQFESADILKLVKQTEEKEKIKRKLQLEREQKEKQMREDLRNAKRKEERKRGIERENTQMWIEGLEREALQVKSSSSRSPKNRVSRLRSRSRSKSRSPVKRGKPKPGRKKELDIIYIE